MITLAVKYFCQPGRSDDVLAALRKMEPLVKQLEPGCKAYQVSRSVDDADLLFLYEQYEDQAALEAHRETAHFKKHIEGEAIPLLVERKRELYTLEIA